MNRAQGNSVGLKAALLHERRSSSTANWLRSVLSRHTADTLHLFSNERQFGSASLPSRFRSLSQDLLNG